MRIDASNVLPHSKRYAAQEEYSHSHDSCQKESLSDADIRQKIHGEWHGRRYYSLSAFLKNNYAYRPKKLSVDCGFTCPNRDGTLDSRGCIFCSAGGSGDFAVPPILPETDQPYIAYFQAYTNTYGPVSTLEKYYRQYLDQPLVCGISIATRPDCLPMDVLHLLALLKQEYPDKFIWVELGLQTIHASTAAYIRRGYPLSCFHQAVHALDSIGIPVIVHTILGLPGEDLSMMIATMEALNALPVAGVKLQLLHVLEGTDLARDYRSGFFSVLEMEDYISIVIHCLEHLSPSIVIHRVTGDGPRNLLIAPLWSCHKKKVLNTLHHQLKVQDSYQGKALHSPHYGSLK